MLTCPESMLSQSFYIASESTAKPLGQINSKTLDQGLSVSRPILSVLIKFHDAPADLPIGSDYQCIEAVNGGGRLPARRRYRRERRYNR